MGQTQKVAVIGAGAMGSQIAMLAAMAGCQTTMVDVDQERLDAARDQVLQTAQRQAERGRLEADAVEQAAARLTTEPDLAAAVAEADVVVEAIIEDLEAKRDLFAQLGEHTRPDTILATNSSSIVSSRLAQIPHPERVCNMHFFNPALVMRLVEVVGGDHTSQKTIETVKALAERMGKTPVVVRQEIFGFIANRIVAAIFDEAISLYEQGIASAEDIDTAVTHGLGHPIGPFALLDLTGIDVNVGIKRLEAQETGDPSRGPSQTLLDLMAQGRLGRKTGHGFYEYGDR
ncbi:3-hydroxyacyl-CoA dehydrogenase family protein [Micrococcus sp. XM4230A]|uniref:3-hydroxyacyl-CoA dehydrogenase family protein n=1 Tax=Micrococcus TaxID=1269 RepID=UPI000EFCBAFB|nr:MULTISPECIES: 3-hydroxyacyl-CoA dehydrogenase family protein [Micrococcus]AYO48967.1 3-hydroxyacyl-CoA dehydrogenase family protein [Micrococcus luteus]MCK1799982.1 3-hydroxyacyl-CoA dehydrogenase family protein [Micrococcus sp. XM4230B]MCK1811008.1 3-hydroxyacyl-CoA dehydrogenase family protein [Micrococcus sp. XM4230A]